MLTQKLCANLAQTQHFALRSQLGTESGWMQKEGQESSWRQKDSVTKTIADKATYLALIPAFIVTGILDTLTGTLYGLGAAIPTIFDKKRDWCSYSLKNLGASTTIFYLPYLCALKVLNKDALQGVLAQTDQAWIKQDGKGLSYGLVVPFIYSGLNLIFS